MSAVLRLSYGDTLPLRFMEQSNVDPHQPVCIGLFQGDKFTHKVFGASERSVALREARKIRARGVAARLEWLNTGAWCAELWTKDLTRPLETHPDTFYGRLQSAANDNEETTGTVRRPVR